MVTCSNPLTVLWFVVAGFVLIAGCAADATLAVQDVPSEPLRPVRFRQIKISGFWKDQVKRLTEKWIPHCIKQMEKGGWGQELLNLVRTAKVLRGEPTTGKFTGCRWSDAYVYNTIEAISHALAFDPVGDKALADAQAFLRKKLDDRIRPNIELVDHIALSPRGKAVYVDQRIADRSTSS